MQQNISVTEGTVVRRLSSLLLAAVLVGCSESIPSSPPRATPSIPGLRERRCPRMSPGSRLARRTEQLLMAN